MADTKLSALNALTAIATNDQLEVLDVSDTVTMSSASGANKRILRSDFLAGVYQQAGGAGGTAVTVADGGTGSTAAINARGSLGLGIGTAVQAWDADLDAFAGLTSGANLFPYYTGTNAMTTATFVPWTAYTPSFQGGFSGTPQGGIYRYTQIGKMVAVNIVQNNPGTSNAATKSIMLPVQAGTAAQAFFTAIVVDNGTVCAVGTNAAVGLSGTVVTFHKGWGGLNGWTTSGTARIAGCSIVYEAA